MQRPPLDDEARRRRRAVARRVLRRRRVAAAAISSIALLALLLGILAGGGGDDAEVSRGAGAEEGAPPELPGGGRRIFPRRRVVAYYGAPQARALGALGVGTPDQAVRRLRRQARPYERRSRPVLLALELIATVASSRPGPDGLYRTRQPAAVIDRYLAAARRARALLVLDIQPGHADFLSEVERLRPWLEQPDVGLALDPEWHVPGGVPGQAIGSVSADEVNEVSLYLSTLARGGRLPEKLFVVHVFTPQMVRAPGRVRHRPGLAVTVNVDGFGDRAIKLAKYRELTGAWQGFHFGFKLFYEEDTGLMGPGAVLRLRPPPELVVYE